MPSCLLLSSHGPAALEQSKRRKGGLLPSVAVPPVQQLERKSMAKHILTFKNQEIRQFNRYSRKAWLDRKLQKERVKKIMCTMFHQESALLLFAKWQFMSLENCHRSRSNSECMRNGAKLLWIPQAAAHIHFEDRCSITFSQLHTKARNPSMCSLLSWAKRQSSKQESSNTNLIYLNLPQRVTCKS